MPAAVCAGMVLLAGCAAGEPAAAPAGNAAAPAGSFAAPVGSSAASPPAAESDCRSSDLSAALGTPETGQLSDVAVGSMRVVLTNRSAATCFVAGGISGRLEGPATRRWAASLDLPLDGEAGEVRIPAGQAAEAVLVYLDGTDSEQPWDPATLLIAVPGDPQPISVPWPSGESVLQGTAAVSGDMAVNRFQPLTVAAN
ncbi:hypothetical protein Acsp01_58410 [Actinoplanes sp. NBRC 101535]|nr:hypothetical protein Acsp01_58410 [Actinoplanes sp. NBRC 101535]